MHCLTKIQLAAVALIFRVCFSVVVCFEYNGNHEFSESSLSLSSDERINDKSRYFTLVGISSEFGGYLGFRTDDTKALMFRQLRFFSIPTFLLLIARTCHF